MALDPATLPNNIAALKALLIAADARAIDLDGQIAQLKLTIAKMRRKTFGASSEKGARLLFCGSGSGGQRAAAIYTLIETCLCRVRHKQVYAARWGLCRMALEKLSRPAFFQAGLPPCSSGLEGSSLGQAQAP